MENKRENLGSRLGFILLSAGCAIGLGNVWMFPYRVGNNGGGAFVLMYVIALIVLGIPIMTAEFAVGRAAQKSPSLMYQELEQPGSKWHLHGILCIIGNTGLMMFYTTVAGYFYRYLVGFASGNTESLSWVNTITTPGINVLTMVIVVVLGFVVLSFDMQKGLERVTKYMMLAMFILLIVLAVKSCMLPGAAEGLTFYLKPDFSQITIKTVIAAMNQAFFSLSLGIGSMSIFGSYIGKDRTLLGESINVIALDTLVAVVAGFIIFPACFTFGINPDAGPPLLFTTMVTVFQNMNHGMFWGAIFFVFMIFAAMSTVFAVFENILAMIRDKTGWSRKKGCLICCIGMLILCMPMAIDGWNVTGWFQPFGEGTGWFDLVDYIVETFAQPLGSIIFLLFVSHRFGWNWKSFTDEANAGTGPKVRNWMIVVFGYISPIIVFALWVYGLISFNYC